MTTETRATYRVGRRAAGEGGMLPIIDEATDRDVGYAYDASDAGTFAQAPTLLAQRDKALDALENALEGLANIAPEPYRHRKPICFCETQQEGYCTACKGRAIIAELRG